MPQVEDKNLTVKAISGIEPRFGLTKDSIDSIRTLLPDALKSIQQVGGRAQSEFMDNIFTVCGQAHTVEMGISQCLREIESLNMTIRNSYMERQKQHLELKHLGQRIEQSRNPTGFDAKSARERLEEKLELKADHIKISLQDTEHMLYGAAKRLVGFLKLRDMICRSHGYDPANITDAEINAMEDKGQMKKMFTQALCSAASRPGEKIADEGQVNYARELGLLPFELHGEVAMFLFDQEGRPRMNSLPDLWNWLEAMWLKYKERPKMVLDKLCLPG